LWASHLHTSYDSMPLLMSGIQDSHLPLGSLCLACYDAFLSVVAVASHCQVGGIQASEVIHFEWGIQFLLVFVGHCLRPVPFPAVRVCTNTAPASSSGKSMSAPGVHGRPRRSSWLSIQHFTVTCLVVFKCNRSISHWFQPSPTPPSCKQLVLN
jgi:hypothetical protein